ncbi:hypothetical protein MSG28_008257 [Choristoneura fumiferana]|uniref:Uncharacterized protein n=1 Tax=Choristoneura fumiferana TaxID=7141 RepID=A0ACC0JAS8_CHOFU|nr:hypothetical protein MSG28_008257 [Choristoneura fumiferana]
MKKMATEVSAAPMALPQLQSVQKAMAIPTVGAAVGQFGALYTRVKDAHSLLEWALSTAEAGVTLAAHTAAPFVSAPLAAGDARLASCIDALERRVPLVNEQPDVIVETTKKAVLSKISPHVNKVIGARVAAEQRVKSLKELSWTKANSLLNTAYGQKALIGVDSGATYAMQLLDHYLPPVGPQDQPTASSSPSLSMCLSRVCMWSCSSARMAHNISTGTDSFTDLGLHDKKISTGNDSFTDHGFHDKHIKVEGEIVPASADPAMHTVQTVGRLSAVAARRVWANLAYKVNELRQSGIDFDVSRYLKALLAALHLATVTNQQHQKEAARAPSAEHPAEPSAPEAPPETHDTAPTTANKVKSTPEAKSENHSN